MHPILLALTLQAPVPVEIAPGPLATPADELNAAFTPDGNSVYFTRKLSKDSAVIVVSHRDGERWSEPRVASFSGRAPDYDPFITPDGQRIFWMSKRAVNGAPKQDFDLWMAKRVGQEWAEPVRLPEPINSDAGEYFPSASRNGNLYFSSNRAGGSGRGDIYRSRLVDGAYRSAENLGSIVNSTGFDGDPLIAPDERFLIFTGWGRPGGDPEGDLYISYRTDRSWSVPVALPAGINSAAQEYAPGLSPDGVWLYFASYRNGENNGDVYRVRVDLLLRARD